MSKICSAKGLPELACLLDEFLACSWSRQTCHWSKFPEFFLDTLQFQGFYCGRGGFGQTYMFLFWFGFFCVCVT